jgi:hypothetical protein
LPCFVALRLFSRLFPRCLGLLLQWRAGSTR